MFWCLGVSCPHKWLSRRFAAHSSSGVYLYSFGYNSSAPGSAVFHGGEVAVVWQNFDLEKKIPQLLLELNLTHPVRKNENAVKVNKLFKT